MKLLPIEPGCRAVTSHKGLVVPVGTEVIVTGPMIRDGYRCAICLSNAWWPVETAHIKFLSSQCGLIRIDGGDFSHERETEKVREKV